MKYELLKDTVMGKSGDVFIEDTGFPGYRNQSLLGRRKRLYENNYEAYSRDVVENNPEWFKEINQQTVDFTIINGGMYHFRSSEGVVLLFTPEELYKKLFT